MSYEPNPVSHENEPTESATKPRRWPWIASIVAALLFGFGIGAAGDTTEPVAAEPETVEVEVPGEIPAADLAELTEQKAELDEREGELQAQGAELVEREAALDEREAAVTETEEQVAANTIAGNGLYLIGEDIEPGRYRADASDCYWARLSSTNTNDIIVNWYDSGPTIADIAESDVAFETSGCGEWVKQ